MTIDSQPPGISHVKQQIEAMKYSEQSRVFKGEAPWPHYESPLKDYDSSFAGVTPRGGIKKVLSELTKEKGKSDFNVLDVAGQGTPFIECKDDGVSHITAISLGDYRDEEKKAAQNAIGLTYIEGDIFDEAKRAEIAKSKYDLITFRPSGGRYIVASPQIGFDLLSFMYNVLGESGVILMEVSEEMNSQGTQWINNLARTPGIEVRYSNPPPRNRQSHILVRKKQGGPNEITSVLENSPHSKIHAFFIDNLTWEKSEVLPIASNSI